MSSPSARVPCFIAGVTALTCLGFAAFTGHIWEDYFITFRSSLNLATGHGFVFQPGERVHTFTSPLGTLLPALFALGGGNDVALRALWIFRVVSALALGGALWLAARTMLRVGLTAAVVAVAGLVWALDPKTVDFSINGMESALLVFFVVVTWWAFVDGAKLLPCALGFAGLQWTRPDGCVFFGAIAVAWLFCGERTVAAPWRSRFWFVTRPVLLGALFFLPWVVFAWSYYGSPVPHTILAKVSQHGPGELSRALCLYPVKLLFGHVALHGVFMPAYYFFGGWPSVLGWLARFVAVGGALAWLVPGVRPAGRVAALAFFLGGFYVEYIPRSPWYYPGWQTLCFLAWAFLADAALRAENPRRWARPIVRIGAAVTLLVQAALFVGVACQMRAQQTVVEYGQRREIGQWLRAQAAAGDRVYLEPLGYIGFYSGLKMLDYPGLASPEVVAARRAGHRTHAQVIAALQPEWLVLRPDQTAGVLAEAPALLGENYELARTFDVRANVAALSFLPGREYLEFDALYFVFQHRRPARAAGP